MYVSSRAVAEEVVQEAWIAVLTGIDRFEERSSLKTWIFRILSNKAKTRAEREGRTVPFSSLGDPDDDEPAVDPDRFVDTGMPGRGPWATPPRALDRIPEERLLAREAQERIVAAIVALPPAQRAVITLRDVDGLSRRGGLRRARPERGQPARAAPPRALEGARRVRALPRGGGPLMAVRDVSCQEIVELVTDYLEDALPRDERKAFEAHLVGLPDCTNYLDQMRETIRLTGRLTEESLEPELRAKLLDAFGDFTPAASNELLSDRSVTTASGSVGSGDTRTRSATDSPGGSHAPHPHHRLSPRPARRARARRDRRRSSPERPRRPRLHPLATRPPATPCSTTAAPPTARSPARSATRPAARAPAAASARRAPSSSTATTSTPSTPAATRSRASP